MSDTYDVQFFEPDYCHDDITKIVAAIKGQASLMVIGMPGCGKSRLIDFLLHRSDVQRYYGLADHLKFIRVDGDSISTGARGAYIELLSALDSNVQVVGNSNLDILKNQLNTEVRNLEKNVDLIVIFDNFVQSLQDTLGENFFNFLFALRNRRQKLNVIYIFMANLKIDFTGFYKLGRLFDKGAGRSVCWLSLLTQKDTFFSIDRQLLKIGMTPDSLTQSHKERIFELSGGHALLMRYLTHLMLDGEVSLETELDQVLIQGGIHAACQAIWNDLKQPYQNYLIDLITGHQPPTDSSQSDKVLRNYGVLKDQTHVFSPLFASFLKTQRKIRSVVDIHCDELQTKIIVRMLDSELSFEIRGLSQRKRKLLCYLIQNQDETCHKDKLIAVGWPSDYEQGVSDRALSGQIDGLRSWLKQQVQLSQYIAIETIWGEGYQLLVKE